KFQRGYRVSLSTEHYRADFDSADTRMSVERDSQRLPRKLRRWNVWTECSGVDVDRVSAGRLDNLNPGCQQFFTDVLRAANAIAEIVFVQNLLKSLRHRLEIAARESAVGYVPFCQNEQVARALKK